MDTVTSCADGFAAVIRACRDLSLTGVDDDTVRRPHRRVDEFRHAEFSRDAERLTRLARRLAAVAVVDRGAASPVADWTGRSGRSADVALQGVNAELADLFVRVDEGARVTAQADLILGGVLRRHRGVLETVSRPRLGGFDLEALPAALNSGAVSPHTLRGEIQARLEYADAAGALADEAIVSAVDHVATAWAMHIGSDGELALADLQ